MDKAQLRQQFQKTLISISQEQRRQKSKKACERLIGTEQFERANTVMAYLALPHEADTSDLILCAWQQGKTVVAPKISWQQRHMIPVEINALDTGFSTEVGGLKNPVKGAPIPFEQIDLIIAPGLGFDSRGSRLGRGGGYYDRFFKNEGMCATRCGFGFAEQVIDSIPTTERDVPMDLLVTDADVMYFNSKQG